MSNKSELQYKAECMGIRLRGTETTEELKDVLAATMRSPAYWGAEADPSLLPLLPQLPVMLARNVTELSEVELAFMLTNEEEKWIAEEKLDGVRAKLHLLGSGDNRIDSRHRSDVTYEYVEKTGCLPHLAGLEHGCDGTVLDGELLMPVECINDGKTQTDSYLTATTATVNSSPQRAIELQKRFGECVFWAFDILFLQGKDVRPKAYTERYAELDLVREHLKYRNGFPHYIMGPARCVRGIKSFYERYVAGGGEGVMLKRLDCPYEGGKRSKGMYKWKKSKDLDVFVTGFVPGKGEFRGLVGALLVSVMVGGKAIEVGAVQPGDLAFRQSISTVGDGCLTDNMYGKVVEVSYLCKTKNGRLRHVVLKRFRPDKNCYDCELEDSI